MGWPPLIRPSYSSPARARNAAGFHFGLPPSGESLLRSAASARLSLDVRLRSGAGVGDGIDLQKHSVNESGTLSGTLRPEAGINVAFDPLAFSGIEQHEATRVGRLKPDEIRFS
jgi:hypothetical protein